MKQYRQYAYSWDVNSADKQNEEKLRMAEIMKVVKCMDEEKDYYHK